MLQVNISCNKVAGPKHTENVYEQPNCCRCLKLHMYGTWDPITQQNKFNKTYKDPPRFKFCDWCGPDLLFKFFFFFFQTLYNQFKFFLNMYFLVVATSQFITELRIGYLYTYWAPLVSNYKDVIRIPCISY